MSRMIKPGECIDLGNGSFGVLTKRNTQGHFCAGLVIAGHEVYELHPDEDSREEGLPFAGYCALYSTLRRDNIPEHVRLAQEWYQAYLAKGGN